MPVEVILPKVDMDMATGTISAWHVEEGAEVAKGQPLFDIETDKAAMEVEAEAAGRLHHRAPTGQPIEIGTAVAWLYGEGETVGPPPDTAAAEPAADPEPATPLAARGPAPSGTDSPPPPPRTGPRPRTGGAGGVAATPAARARAAAEGLALSAVPGTGPAGRVSQTDVATAQAGPRAPDLSATPAAGMPHGTDLPIGRRGSGDPLVMIHGFAGDALGWLPLAAASGRASVTVELPGHGRAPAGLGDFRALARCVGQALDALPEPRLDLVGHSLGGALALAYADIRPRRIARLTLIAPAGLGPEVDGPTLRGIARASQADSLAPWLKRLAGDPASISWDFVKAAMAAREDPDLRAGQLALAERLFPDDTQGFDLTAALGRLAAPTRILWGRADRILPWRHALAAPGQAALHLLPGLGHIPHLEAPDLVAKIIA